MLYIVGGGRKTRQAMNLYHNTEARSRNHCCHGKAISITYFCVCMCVRALVRMCAYACVHVNVDVGVCVRM